jgi:26S proteasome regulatory subunit N11
MLELAKAYNKAVQEEDEKTAEKFQIDQVGKLDAKKHLQQDIETVMSNNIIQVLGTMLDTVVF